MKFWSKSQKYLAMDAGLPSIEGTGSKKFLLITSGTSSKRFGTSSKIFFNDFKYI